MAFSCAADGAPAAAAVCRHLLSGDSRGFHYEADRDPDQIECPDAWCDECHGALLEAGEWNAEMVRRAEFQVVCRQCYAGLRARNWVQDHAAFRQLSEWSLAFLEAQQEILVRDFNLAAQNHWDCDQDQARLVFSTDGKPAVICDVVIVGSLCTESQTWMWSWADESLRDLRDFGEERGFEKLAGASWDATPDDGWQMTAIAAKYLGAIGAYRAPDPRGFLYMVITRARPAE